MFSYFSPAVAKDEPPDTWDEEEQQEEGKEKLRKTDKDLEFLFQEVVRDSSLDDSLKRDLRSKKSDPKYKEMLVSIMLQQAYLNKPNDLGGSWVVFLWQFIMLNEIIISFVYMYHNANFAIHLLLIYLFFYKISLNKMIWSMLRGDFCGEIWLLKHWRVEFK